MLECPACFAQTCITKLILCASTAVHSVHVWDFICIKMKTSSVVPDMCSIFLPF